MRAAQLPVAPAQPGFSAAAELEISVRRRQCGIY